MQQWINTLRDRRSLPAEGYRAILECEDVEAVEYLHRQAREVAVERFGNEIFVRGLIEISNRCRNNCYYCGIRASNGGVERYSLSRAEILEACREGYELGFRTFVMQGGEDPLRSGGEMVECVREIREQYPDCAITLSLGEMNREQYQRFYDAGANRYLLRHESHSESHYRMLHPEVMSLKNRLECLDILKDIGFQTGTGVMVGSPFQTIDNLVEDIMYIEKFAPQMIGLGPFVPHHATRFADAEVGDIGLTLKMISIFRLIFPSALIPSTTALATIAEDGRERGILAGANVVMPNLSPASLRSHYSLYDNKASMGSESAEGLRFLGERLKQIGYKISFERGDYTNDVSK